MTNQERTETGLGDVQLRKITEVALKATPYVYVENQASLRIIHVTIFMDGQVFTPVQTVGTSAPEFVYTETEAITTEEVLTGYHTVPQGAAGSVVICTIHVDDKDGKRKTTVIYESPRGGK